MVTIRCTVCALDARPRKIGEELLKAGISFRDVADYAEWYRVHEGGNPESNAGRTSKSAWGRHKVEGHFQFKERTVTMDGEVLDLDEFVDKMWSDWQRANKGKVPDELRLMRWIELRSKIRHDLQRKEEEKRMRALLEGAAPNEEEDALLGTGTEGNSGEDERGPDAVERDESPGSSGAG